MGLEILVFFVCLFFSISFTISPSFSVFLTTRQCYLQLCKPVRPVPWTLLLLLNHFSRVRLCNPIDGSPPGSPVPGILHARTLEWVAISFSNAWKWKVKGKSSVVSDSSWPHGLQPTRLLHPWDFPGKSTGVGCHCLLRLEDWAHKYLLSK